jgi:hypothetical protein
MAGIWPFGRGEIRLGKGRMLFVPQRPYLPLGTLASADFVTIGYHRKKFQQLCLGVGHRMFLVMPPEGNRSQRASYEEFRRKDSHKMP